MTFGLHAALLEILCPRSAGHAVAERRRLHTRVPLTFISIALEFLRGNAGLVPYWQLVAGRERYWRLTAYTERYPRRDNK